RRHTRSKRDWSSDVCSSDLMQGFTVLSAPATIQFTELSILVWLCRFCYTVFLVAAPQVNERHVLPLTHLFKDSWEIGLFLTVIQIGRASCMERREFLVGTAA